jgi:hypothetical protein
MLRPTLAAGALFLCILAAASPAAAQPTVKLTTWQSDATGSGVRFEALTPFVETEPPAMQDELADGAFEYALDTAKINWATECSCYRHYAVLVRSRATGVVTRHKFRALPSGSFDDQYAEVMLTIRDGASGGDTRIALPVASAPGLEPKPLLTITRLRDRPESLSLGGVTQVRLTVKNPTKGVAVLIPSAAVVRPESAGLWAHVTASLDRALPLTLQPDATETLTLDIQPQTLRAIEESLVPTEVDKPHTSLHVGVPYANPIFGNRTGSIELAVPIRFRPSILTLLMALSAGVGLGGLVPLLGAKRGRVITWGRATATALVVAIILELVGIFLVANNSKFVLFGFNLDPWQTLPVLLLGIGNGLLGFEAAKKLKFIQDKKAEE